jgi:hypothetical protein
MPRELSTPSRTSVEPNRHRRHQGAPERRQLEQADDRPVDRTTSFRSMLPWHAHATQRAASCFPSCIRPFGRVTTSKRFARPIAPSVVPSLTTKGTTRRSAGCSTSARVDTRSPSVRSTTPDTATTRQSPTDGSCRKRARTRRAVSSTASNTAPPTSRRSCSARSPEGRSVIFSSTKPSHEPRHRCERHSSVIPTSRSSRFSSRSRRDSTPWNCCPTA